MKRPPRLLQATLLLAACLALLPAPARALGLYFETVPTTSSATCPEPCFQIRMFIDDPFNVEVQAVQMDVEILGGGTPALLPIPGQFNNDNAAGGNVNLVDDLGDVQVLPWDLSSTVGKSPMPDFDALVVDAGAEYFDAKTLAAVLAARTCIGSICAIVEAGLASNRIYLGRFNATLDGSPVGLRVGGITGNGPGVTNGSYGLVRLNGADCFFSGGVCRIDGSGGSVPEPAAALLLGAALAVLAGVRRRGRIGAVLLLVIAGGSARAEPPLLIQYQGILLQPDGTPRVGPVDLEIVLLDAPVEGDELYREKHLEVPLVDGMFSISLGGGSDRVPSSLSPGLFAGPGTRWLQVSVDGEPLLPRQQFLSVPYAFEASSAVSLQGQSLAQVVEAPSPLSGFEQLSASAASGSADASCPAGKVAVGGGCDCAAATTESRPVGGFNAWHCECATPNGANRAWVLCAASGDDVCGNGVRDGAEACDSASAAGCPDGRCAAGCVCACGNGVLESPEECDGSAASACGNDICGPDCQCSCGNGVLDAGEQCDGAATQSCPAGSSGCRFNCTCTVCGDGVVDGNEQCDGASATACSNRVCGSNCQCSCGNGSLDAGEQCDGTATQLCPAGSSGCSTSCGCIRCGDGVCSAPETATSCPGDCTRSYRGCRDENDCEIGLFCGAGFCTDSCFQTCDLDPDFEEFCTSSTGFGSCVALCKLDPETSTYVCPNDLVCSNPVSGGNCVAGPLP